MHSKQVLLIIAAAATPQCYVARWEEKHKEKNNKPGVLTEPCEARVRSQNDDTSEGLTHHVSWMSIHNVTYCIEFMLAQHWVPYCLHQPLDGH